MTRWQVFGAVALRRLPEVMPRRDPVQVKVQQIFDAFEASKSCLSQHEMQQIKDNRIRDGEEVTDIRLGETAQDREDRWTKEKESFEFADHDVRLSKTQYLFIQSKFGTDIKDQWLLPQVTFDRKLGDKHLVDTARRALSESLNICHGYRIVSKVPSSVCSLKYPKSIKQLTGFDGAKVFYLKAHLDLPDASVLAALDASKSEKLRWMTRDEAQLVVEKHYMSSLSSGLMHELPVDVNKVLRKASNYARAVKRPIAGSVSQ